MWVALVANRRHDNHKEHLFRYVVRRGRDLIETIIPFFMAHPMHSSKQRDFEKFARCVEMVDLDAHRTRPGLADIAEIAQTMNRRKPRHELISILRDHTPEVHDSGS
jgi:hypothetical protein